MNNRETGGYDARNTKKGIEHADHGNSRQDGDFGRWRYVHLTMYLCSLYDIVIDVLFTGREFFVGISQRTNEGGALAVAAAFPEFPVSPVRIPKSLLHLKSCMSMAGPDILAVSATPEGQEVLKVS